MKHSNLTDEERARIKKQFEPAIPVTNHDPVTYTQIHGVPPGKEIKPGIYRLGTGEIWIGDKY